MIIRYKTYLAYAAVLVGLSVAFTAVSQAKAGDCCGSKTATSSQTGNRSGYQAVQRRNDPPFRPPHGGQLSKTLWNKYEVFYGPQETRIYLYDIFGDPLSARGVQGHVVMHVRSNNTQFQYPLQYAPVEHGQDYLVVRVDLMRVYDGDMDVHYELAGLANRDAPTASFSQVFSMLSCSSSRLTLVSPYV